MVTAFSMVFPRRGEFHTGRPMFLLQAYGPWRASASRAPQDSHVRAQDWSACRTVLPFEATPIGFGENGHAAQGFPRSRRCQLRLGLDRELHDAAARAAGRRQSRRRTDRRAAEIRRHSGDHASADAVPQPARTGERRDRRTTLPRKAACVQRQRAAGRHRADGILRADQARIRAPSEARSESLSRQDRRHRRHQPADAHLRDRGDGRARHRGDQSGRAHPLVDRLDHLGHARRRGHEPPAEDPLARRQPHRRRRGAGGRETRRDA